jgi:hypothetical protein
VSFILLEYDCPRCGRFEELISRSAAESARRRPHSPCGSVAERVISAVRCMTKYGTVTRGKSDPPPPHAMNTQAIADGMTTSEWRQRRKAQRRRIGL